MQRVKNIDYDEDDIYSDEDDYAEGADAGYSQEDKDNFATLTPVVRAELDEAGVPATTQQIEEALWHYFWDVGKSVAYLKNARTPREAKKDEKKDKSKSKFDEAAQKSAKNAGESSHISSLFAMMEYPGRGRTAMDTQGTGACAQQHLRSESKLMGGMVAHGNSTSAADWFRDTPWTGVPAEMLSTFVPVQPLPQVKLLGGSSKLAKLAEERRRKAAAAQNAQSAPADSLSSLDRLSISKDVKENESPVAKPEPKKYPMRRKRSPTPPPREPTPPYEEPEEELPDLRSSPTPFAQTFSTGTGNASQPSKMGLQDLFGSSYNFKVFEGPSPDDTVIQRQQGSKGMNK